MQSSVVGQSCLVLTIPSPSSRPANGIFHSAVALVFSHSPHCVIAVLCCASMLVKSNAHDTMTGTYLLYSSCCSRIFFTIFTGIFFEANVMHQLTHTLLTAVRCSVVRISYFKNYNAQCSGSGDAQAFLSVP